MTNASPVALLHNAGCSIGNDLAAGLAAQNIQVVLDNDAGLSGPDLVKRTMETHGRLDYLFNCLVPGPTTSVDDIFAYPRHLLARNLAAADAMVACASSGAIVNQCFLGSLFQGTPLESAILMAKGAITGLTRDICVNYGKSGIRINTIQLGLVDLPETKGLVTEKTLARKTPVGRWGTPAEVAKFMLFLALRNGYMTGQAICFDGGLTAGNTGT